MTKLVSEIDLAVGSCLSAMEEQEKEVGEKNNIEMCCEVGGGTNWATDFMFYFVQIR